MNRCPWGSDPMMIEYHDKEWGTPVHDDQKLFEFLILDCMQAGLSWSTILHKRAAFRRAFDDFDISKVASFDQVRVQSILLDPGIVRNRMKVEAAIVNARCVLKVQEKHGSFDAFLWNFVGGNTINNNWASFEQIPTETEESNEMSRTLKNEGFKFVGPTICYAFMQAVGMVNDHLVECYRHGDLSK
jgi:DNA-3-methyladenine glycosylase I